MTIGLVLGSGGARGWCHIGVIRALDELGITPGAVAGCSMGALVGGAWAAGRLDELEQWARGLTRSKLLALADLRLSGGLVGGSAVQAVLQEIGVPEDFEELERPFIAVACRLRDGGEVWLSRGNLPDAIRASIAIPGTFKPYHIDGEWLIDGGVSNPVPVSAARALGATRFIAVDPNARGGAPFWEPKPTTFEKMLEQWHQLPLPEGVRGALPQPVEHDEVVQPGAMHVMSGAISILTGYLRETRLAIDQPDVMIDVVLPSIESLELYRADEAIREGFECTMARAEALRALV